MGNEMIKKCWLLAALKTDELVREFDALNYK